MSKAYEIVRRFHVGPDVVDSPYILVRDYGISLSQAREIYDLVPSMFGPGGKGVTYFTKKVESILRRKPKKQTTKRDPVKKRQLGTFKEREAKFEVGKTYEIVTPESAEQGDFEETGWVYDPTVMTLRETFDEISNLGGFEPSEWPMPVTGTHLTLYQTDGDTDYQTGAETREALHIAGRPGPMKRLRQLLKARMHKRKW